jgi:hypothetical protein
VVPHIDKYRTNFAKCPESLAFAELVERAQSEEGYRSFVSRYH